MFSAKESRCGLGHLTLYCTNKRPWIDSMQISDRHGYEHINLTWDVSGYQFKIEFSKELRSLELLLIEPTLTEWLFHKNSDIAINQSSNLYPELSFAIGSTFTSITTPNWTFYKHIIITFLYIWQVQAVCVWKLNHDNILTLFTISDAIVCWRIPQIFYHIYRDRFLLWNHTKLEIFVIWRIGILYCTS